MTIELCMTAVFFSLASRAGTGVAAGIEGGGVVGGGIRTAQAFVSGSFKRVSTSSGELVDFAVSGF
jgi:hypothetical protein